MTILPTCFRPARRTLSSRLERRNKQGLDGRTGRRTTLRFSKTFPRPQGRTHVGRSLGADRRLSRPRALADAANLEATLGQYRALVKEIKQIDLSFVHSELLPPDGIAGLTWQGRDNLINSLRMQRAAAYYRMRGDVGPLQVETLRFLRDAVDAAYEEAVSAADAGRLQP
jgi:hypothetical protein